MTAFGGAITDPTKIMGSRIGAYIVDGIIAFAVVIAAILLIGFDGGSRRIETGSVAAAQDYCRSLNAMGNGDGAEVRSCRVVGTQAVVSEGNVLAAQGMVWGVQAVVMGLNLIVLTTIAGGSLGKLLFGLRVVRSDGSRAGFVPNLIRTVLLVVDAACCAIPGLATSFNSAGHRRIGDMAASTYVVHRSAEGRPLRIPGHLSGAGPSAPGATWGAAPAMDPIIPDFTSTPTGVDTPVFDQSRNAYVRFDPASGAWFQWDDTFQAWVPAAT